MDCKRVGLLLESVLSRWSACIPFCHFHHVYIVIAMEKVLKSGSLLSLQNHSGTSRSLEFCINFRISL